MQQATSCPKHITGTRFTLRGKTRPHFWKSRENRRQYFDFLKSQLGGTYESLYNATHRIVKATGGILDNVVPYITCINSLVLNDTAKGSSLINQKGNTLSSLIIDAYPEHDWHPWKFDKSPQGFWSSIGKGISSSDAKSLCMARQYLEELRERYGIEKVEGWAGFPIQKLTSTDRDRVSHLGNLDEVLRKVYPEINWGPTTTSASSTSQPIYDTESTSPSIAEVPVQQNPDIQILARVCEQLGGKLVDLYKVSKAIVLQHNGRRLLARNRKSASLAVINNYPDHLWLPWKFVNSPLPPYYWKSLKLKLQQRDAHAVQIARLMVLNKTDPLVAPCLHRLGGEHVVEALITHIDLKDSANPLLPYKASGVPIGFWSSPLNRQTFMDFCKKQLGGDYNRLYGLNFDFIVSAGAETLLKEFRKSVANCVMVTYPDHHWQPWKFTRPPQSWWDSVALEYVYNPHAEAALRLYVEEVADQLGVKSLNDWEKISAKNLDYSQKAHFDKCGGLLVLLQRLYPAHDWNDLYVMKRRAAQRGLERRMKQLLSKFYKSI